MTLFITFSFVYFERHVTKFAKLVEMVMPAGVTVPKSMFVTQVKSVRAKKNFNISFCWRSSVDYFNLSKCGVYEVVSYTDNKAPWGEKAFTIIALQPSVSWSPNTQHSWPKRSIWVFCAHSLWKHLMCFNILMLMRPTIYAEKVIVCAGFLTFPLTLCKKIFAPNVCITHVTPGWVGWGPP